MDGLSCVCAQSTCATIKPMLMQPSQADVRRFFCAVHGKVMRGAAMDAMETLASLWIDEHPEFHGDLQDVEVALSQMHAVEAGRTNPFLHLSMHLSISEQCSIDQPPGVRQAVELLVARRDTLHAAHHEVMECLGAMIWESQRSGKPPDGASYIDCVRRRATRD